MAETETVFPVENGQIGGWCAGAVDIGGELIPEGRGRAEIAPMGDGVMQSAVCGDRFLGIGPDRVEGRVLEGQSAVGGDKNHGLIKVIQDGADLFEFLPEVAGEGNLVCDVFDQEAEGPSG